ncbi:MAG TPA: ATP-binding cassette domain-containing protein [Conexibacter sp.]|nr:ATP-binding cassette domain-containing protein [Conexibacter sp.]
MTAAATPPLAAVEQLVKRFPLTRGVMLRRRLGEVPAVDGVTLEVREGESLGIVGETGSGKSTLARILLNLLEPTSGVVRWRGEDVTHARGAALEQLRRKRQMVFQDPAGSLNPRKTVGAAIADPFAIHGLLPERAARAGRVSELLEQVGLEPALANRYPHELSGGMRQRVGIARAIALDPELLVADEPVSALDVSIQAQILTLLRDLRRELGLTLVLIAHDLAVVRHVCDRVAVMHDGKLVEVAPVEELYRAPREDYTRELLAAVPRIPGLAPGAAPASQPDAPPAGRPQSSPPPSSSSST